MRNEDAIGFLFAVNYQVVMVETFVGSANPERFGDVLFQPGEH
jgi:hypothetical protein